MPHEQPDFLSSSIVSGMPSYIGISFQTVIRQRFPASHDWLNPSRPECLIRQCSSAGHTEGEDQLLVGELIAELGKCSVHGPLIYL